MTAPRVTKIGGSHEPEPAPSQQVVFYHNTLFGLGSVIRAGAGQEPAVRLPKSFVWFNNIFYAVEGKLARYTGRILDAVVFDNNLYFQEDAEATFASFWNCDDRIEECARYDDLASALADTHAWQERLRDVISWLESRRELTDWERTLRDLPMWESSGPGQGDPGFARTEVDDRGTIDDRIVAPDLSPAVDVALPLAARCPKLAICLDALAGERVGEAYDLGAVEVGQALRLNSVWPTRRRMQPGRLVVIKGSGFDSRTSVWIGDELLNDVAFVSPTTLFSRVPESGVDASAIFTIAGDVGGLPVTAAWP